MGKQSYGSLGAEIYVGKGYQAWVKGISLLDGARHGFIIYT